MFEYEVSKREINFLDTATFKVDNGLRIEVYVKQTDMESYLHRTF